PPRPKSPPDFAEEPLLLPPPELATTCSGKTVGVSMTIAEDGTLSSAKVISSSGVLACDEVVLSAVAQARFKAALAADGKPVEGRFVFSARF
ncbi:MAG TPA: TonB family protein, partial [Thermoanaerobaculia bacterium]|nr:TonB family protein [Thermoanaerobaculia bacterium]